MKLIYKTLIVVSLFLFSVSVNAQLGDKYVAEFRGGINFSEMDIAGANMYKQSKVGFHISSAFGVRLIGPLYAQTGLGLTKKGLKQHDKSIQRQDATGIITKRDIRTTIDANYIQLPLMLGLEFPIKKDWIVNIYGGGYAAYGFKGKWTVEGTETRDPDSSDPVVYDRSEAEVDTFDYGRLKKFDYGLIGSVGLVVDIFSFNLGYEYGLYNVSDNASRELKNRNATFSVGIRF